MPESIPEFSFMIVILRLFRNILDISRDLMHCAPTIQFCVLCIFVRNFVSLQSMHQFYDKLGYEKSSQILLMLGENCMVVLVVSAVVAVQESLCLNTTWEDGRK